MKALYDIKQLLRPERYNIIPSDDFRIINSWVEYEDNADKNFADAVLKFMCYEIETMNPETGDKIKLYKAVRFVRVIRLPKDAKQSTSIMDKHEQIIAAAYENEINLISIIANIIKPTPLGLLYLYGVQAVAEDIESAKEKCKYDFIGFVSSMQGTYRVLEMRIINAQETEWLKEKIHSMNFVTSIRGIPFANKSGEDAGNKGYGGRNLNPDSHGVLEEIITGLADYEYIIEVLSTPVRKNTLEAWLTKSERQMTGWYNQLQGNTGLSFNISLPMMYASNIGANSGWSHGYTNADSVNYSNNESFSTSAGESFGQSMSHSLSDSISESINQSVSSGESTSQSVNISQGISHSVGISQSESLNTSISKSISESFGENLGSSYGINSGENIGSSHSLGESFTSALSHTQGISESLTESQSESLSHSISQSYGHTDTVTDGVSMSNSWNTSHSVGEGFGFSDSYSDGSSLSESAGLSNTHSEGVNSSTSSSAGITNSEGNSGGVGGNLLGLSGNVSHNTGQSLSDMLGSANGMSVSEGLSSNFSHSNSANFGENHGVNHSQSLSDSFGEGVSLSSTQSVGSSDSYTYGQSESYSQGISQGHSVGSTESYGTSLSNGLSENYGTTMGKSLGESWGTSMGQSHGMSIGSSMSKGYGYSIGTSETAGTSESVSQGQSHSQSNSISQSYGTSKSNSESYGTSQSYGQNQSVSSSQGYGSSNGNSKSNSLGSSGGISSGISSTMGLAPSIGYNRSHQWLDQEVKDLIELLEYQNERLKSSLRGNGAFYTYVYIACPNRDVLSAAMTVAKSTWHNEDAMVNPLQVLELSIEEQKHLLYHFAAFSNDITKEDVYGIKQYKYCTVLLPKEFVAYSHLPRVSEGGVFSEVNDIPKFSYPSLMKGEIYLGNIMSAERWTMQHGYNTPCDYRLDESELMHAIITAGSRVGKTVLAMRFIAELANIKRKSTGKRLRIVCMDPKRDWRTISKFVEPERFRFYSLGNINFHPIKLNPWKVPRGIQPQIWIDGVIDIYCRAYGLLERGKQMIADIVYELYDRAGVFKACDNEDWVDKVHELSAKVSFEAIYKSMERKRDNLATGKKVGFDTMDAYARLLDRLSCFGRAYSIERRLFGSSEGISVDEMIGDDDVTVLESQGLENTFKNFIFGVITSGFYQYAKAQEKGFLSKDQYETVLVIEEANEVLGGGSDPNRGGSEISGQSQFEQILDQAAGYGLFIFAITQQVSLMPKSIVANAGLKFVGRLGNEEDIKQACIMIGKEPVRTDIDVFKWIPKSPIGVFIAQSTRGYDYKSMEPVLINVAPLNTPVPSNSELEDIILQKKVKETIKRQTISS